MRTDQALLQNNVRNHAAHHRACFRRRPEATYFDVLPLDPLVDAITDMMPTKGEKGTYFCVSFRDVFDVVLCQKLLFSSNHLKFGRVFFEIFIKSLMHPIDFKAANLLVDDPLRLERPALRRHRRWRRQAPRPLRRDNGLLALPRAYHPPNSPA